MRLQHEIPTLIFVADLHAITVWQDSAKLKQQSARSPLRTSPPASTPTSPPFSPNRLCPSTPELAWVFNCVARLGWLDRMTQFKDKAGKHAERESVGLYTYPVLQAADIPDLQGHPRSGRRRPKAEPGVDAISRARFNNDFSVPGFFPLPEPLAQGPGARVMSLRDGSAKMSKSDPSGLCPDQPYRRRGRHRSENQEGAHRRRPAAGHDQRPGRPARAKNLVAIYAALSGKTEGDVLGELRWPRVQRLQPALAELAVSVMGPIAGEMRRWLANPSEIDRVLTDGAARARAIGAPTMAEVRKIVGFWGS